MPEYTVSPITGSSRWKVEKDGTRVDRHNTKQNAVERARELASKYNGHVTVQNKNGQFQRRFTPR